MGLAALAAATAVTLSTSLTPSVIEPDVACAWRHSALRLYQELAGEEQPRAGALRALLADFGVGQEGFLPERCRSGPDRSSDRGEDRDRAGHDPSMPSNGAEVSAAERYGWGEPNRVEEFDNVGSLHEWNIYDGPGHAGNGRRTPEAVSVSDGILTITGDAQGNTAGMAWLPGQKYGRWEGRVRAPASDETYNALLLLWPDAENFRLAAKSTSWR